MARKSKTKLSFQVTFEVPEGANIKSSREFLINAIASEVSALNPDEVFKKLDPKNLKVHLVNKETTYG